MTRKKNILKTNQWFKKKTSEKTNHEEVSCKNCETTFKGNYCPECGQSTNEYDKPFSFVFYNFMGDFFSFDVRFFKTFIALISNPGFLTKEYFEGRRVRYAPPLRVFIFTSFMLFFLLQVYTNRGLSTVLDKSFPDQPAVVLDSVSRVTLDSLLLELPGKDDSLSTDDLAINLDFETFKDTRDLRSGLTKLANILESDLEKTTDPVKREKLKEYIKLCYSPEQVIARLLKYLSWAFFLLLPVFALILKLFYIRRKHNYMRHLIFSIHIHSFVFIAISIVTLIYYFVEIESDGLTKAIILSVPVYFFIALKKFYGQSLGKVFVKFIGISFLYNIIFWITFGIVALNAISVI